MFTDDSETSGTAVFGIRLFVEGELFFQNYAFYKPYKSIHFYKIKTDVRLSTKEWLAINNSYNKELRFTFL